MHDLLPQLPDPRHGRRVVTEHPTKGLREYGVEGRSGAVHTVKIRAVCHRCNNGWMNRLEHSARPFLTPLINGTPVVLDFEQMLVVARWMTMKCIVAEHSSRDDALTPEPDRSALRENGTIPDYFHIYVISHCMPPQTGYVRHSSCVSLNSPTPNPPLLGMAKNIQTISFVLGSVVVHLNASRVKDYTIESRFRTEPINVWQHCRIWPFQDFEMVWPRRPMLDGNGIRTVSTAWAKIRAASPVTWRG
jgi:hypothetical protein